jgi:hypothetical protein
MMWSAHLGALQGIERLDLVEGEARERLYDIPFNVEHGEVVVTPRVEDLRKLPASTHRMRLVAVDASASVSSANTHSITRPIRGRVRQPNRYPLPHPARVSWWRRDGEFTKHRSRVPPVITRVRQLEYAIHRSSASITQ